MNCMLLYHKFYCIYFLLYCIIFVRDLKLKMVYRKNYIAPPKQRRLFLESLPSLTHLVSGYQKNKSTLPDLGGFTAPWLTGRPHMGPGNRVYPEKISDVDEPYRQHDIGYGRLPWWKYMFFNSADAKLMSDLASSKNPVDMGVNSFFAAKAKYTGTIGAFLEMSHNIIKQMADQFGWNTVNNSVIKSVLDKGVLNKARSFQVPGEGIVDPLSPNLDPRARVPRDFRPTSDPIPGPSSTRNPGKNIYTKIKYRKY